VRGRPVCASPILVFLGHCLSSSAEFLRATHGTFFEAGSFQKDDITYVAVFKSDSSCRFLFDLCIAQVEFS
jgi:uncharacterized membrane protein YhhN